MVKYGHLLEMHVCDNVSWLKTVDGFFDLLRRNHTQVGDHLIGNVYARYDC